MFLLDTNVVSELRRPRPHGAVLGWMRATDDADLHLSAVTLGELQASLELTRAQGPDKAAELQRWLDAVGAQYAVLPMDGRTFREWARLMHARSDTLYEDAMIAATARVHGLTVVTHKVKDFRVFDVPVPEPRRRFAHSTPAGTLPVAFALAYAKLILGGSRD